MVHIRIRTRATIRMAFFGQNHFLLTGPHSLESPTPPLTTIGKMQFTLHATRRTPHRASRLVQAMSAWLVKTRRAPSRHSRNARVYGHTTTAMHKLSTPPPLPLSTWNSLPSSNGTRKKLNRPRCIACWTKPRYPNRNILCCARSSLGFDRLDQKTKHRSPDPLSSRCLLLFLRTIVARFITLPILPGCLDGCLVPQEDSVLLDPTTALDASINPRRQRSILIVNIREF